MTRAQNKFFLRFLRSEIEYLRKMRRNPNFNRVDLQRQEGRIRLIWSLRQTLRELAYLD
jgi:hypothetical protein